MENEKKHQEKKGLHANVKIEGLENIKDISADSKIEIQATCTEKTEVNVKLFEA